MTFDTAIDAFAGSQTVPYDAVEWMLENWDAAGPACLALLHAYVAGHDRSERTERAMFFITHLLGERGETGCFAPLCALLRDHERADLLFGDDALTISVPAILISTFDGEAARLHALVEDPAVDDLLRGDVLLVLAYLVRARSIPESQAYDYLAALPDRLQPREMAFVWFGWVRAVAALGFMGLTTAAEALFKAGLVDPDLMSPEGFWQDLREARENPGGTNGMAWEGIGPMGSTMELLRGWETSLDEEDAGDLLPPEPVRNPLRDVGRNDPCPCGSGKKFKKCCLAA